MYFNKIMVIKSVFVTPSKTIHNFSKIKKICNKPKYVNMCSVNTYFSSDVPKHMSLACTFRVNLQGISHQRKLNTCVLEPKAHGMSQEFFLKKNHLFFSVQKRKKNQVTPIFFNFTFDKGRLKNLVSWTLQNYGKYKTLELLEQLKKTGFEYATKAGISLGIDDLKIPPKKKSLLLSAEKLTKSTVQQYERGEITAVERFQRLIDTWHRTSEQLKQEVIAHFEETDILNPVYMMAFSGARGNISQVRQLVGMRGLMSDPQGQIIDFPIRSNFREGLTLTEYIISSYGARKGIVDTALRTANAGYLTRRLVDVAQHVMISHYDCGTLKGIFLTDMKEGNKTLVSVQNRIVGRVLARDIFKPNTTIKIASRNQEITTDLAFEIKKITNRVFVRSSLTCNTNKLLCQLCYGWSLAQGNLVSVGEAVGVIAAQSIGEPGTQLTMRTFHTGGVFSGDISDEIRAPYNGFIHYENQIPGILIRTIDGKIRFLTKADGILFFSLSSKSYFSTTQDLDVRKFKIPAYTILFMRNTEEVIKKQVVAQITSINTKLNIRDTAEFVIKAELEGVFYGKKLEISKKILGPKPKIFGEDIQKLSVDRTQLEYNGINPKAMEIIVKARGWNFAWVLSGKRYETPLLLKLFPSIGDYVNNQTIMARHNLQVPKNYSVSLLNNSSISKNIVTNQNIYGAKGAARFFFALSHTLKTKPSNQKLTKQDTLNVVTQVWDQIKKTKNNTKNSLALRSNFSKIKKFFLFKVFRNAAIPKHSDIANTKEQGQQRKYFHDQRLKTLTKNKVGASQNLKTKFEVLSAKAKNRKKGLNNKLNKLIRFPSLYQEKSVNTTIKLNSQFSIIKSLITKKLFSSNPLYNGLYQDQKTKANLSSSLEESYTSKIKQDTFGLQENLAMNKIFIKQDLLFLNTRKIKYYKIGYFHFINKQHNLNNIPTLFFNKDKERKLVYNFTTNYPENKFDPGQGQVILLSPSALKKEYILDREIKLKRIKSLSYLVESSCLHLSNRKDNLAFFTKKKPLMKPYKFKENPKTGNLLIPKEKSSINISKALPNTKSIQSVCPSLYEKNINNFNKLVTFPQTKFFTPNKKNQLEKTSLLQTKINFSKQLFVKILQTNISLGENLKHNRHNSKKIAVLNKNKTKNQEQKNIMLFTIIKNSPDLVLIKRKIKKYKNIYKTNTLNIGNKTDKLTKHLNLLKNFRSNTEKKNNIVFSEIQRAKSLPLVLQKTKTSLQSLLYKTYLKDTFKRVWKTDSKFQSVSKVFKGQGLKKDFNSSLIAKQNKKEQPLITQYTNIKDKTKFIPKETLCLNVPTRKKGLGFIILSKDKKLLDFHTKNFFPTNYVLYKKSAVQKIRDTFSDQNINNFILKKETPSKEVNVLSNKVKTVFEYIVPFQTISAQKLGLGSPFRFTLKAKRIKEQSSYPIADFNLLNKENTQLGLKGKQDTSILENTKKILKHFKKNKIKKVNLYKANKVNSVVLQKSNYLNHNLLENKNYIKPSISSSSSLCGFQATRAPSGCTFRVNQAKTKITKKLLKYTIKKFSNTDQITTKLISFFKKAFMQNNRTFKIKNALKKLIINKRKFLLTQKQFAYIFMYFQLKQKHIFNLEYFKQLKNINVSYKSIIENVKKANRSKKKNKKLQVTKVCQTKRLKAWLKKTKLTRTYSYQSILLTTKTKIPDANQKKKSINSPRNIKFALISNKGVRFLQKNKLHMNINKNLNIFLTKLNGRKKFKPKQKLKQVRKNIVTKNINFQDRHLNGVTLNNLKKHKKNTKSTIAFRVNSQRGPKVHGDSLNKVKRLQEHSFLETDTKLSKENLYELVYIVLYNNKIELNSKQTPPSWIYKTANPLGNLKINHTQGNPTVLVKNKAINTGFNPLTIYPGYSNLDTLLFNNVAIQPCFTLEKKQYFWDQRSNILSKDPNAYMLTNALKSEVTSKKRIRKKQISITKKLREKYEILLTLLQNPSPFSTWAYSQTGSGNLEKQNNSVGTNKQRNKSLFVKDFNYSILPEIFKQNLVWVKNKNPRFLPKHLEQKTQSFNLVTKNTENQLMFNDTFQSTTSQDYLNLAPTNGFRVLHECASYSHFSANWNLSGEPTELGSDSFAYGISEVEKNWQTVALIFKQIASANINTFFVPGLDSSKQQITKYSLILYLNYLYKLNKINLGLENRPNKKTIILYIKNLKNNLKEILTKKTLHYILFNKLPEVNIMADTGLQKINKQKTGLKLITSIPSLETPTEVAELRFGKLLGKLDYTRNKQHLSHSKNKIKQIKKLERHFYTYIIQDHKDKTYTNYYSKQKKDLNLLKKNPSFAHSILSFQIHQKININQLNTNIFNRNSTWQSSNKTKVGEKQFLKNSIIRKVNSSKLMFSNVRSFNSLDTKQKNNKKIKLKQSLKSSNQSNQNYKKLISYTNLPFFSSLFKTSSYKFTYTAKNSKLLNLYNLHSKTKVSIIPNQPCLNFVFLFLKKTFINLIKNKQTSLKKQWKSSNTSQTKIKASFFLYSSLLKNKSFNRQKFKPSNTLFLKKLEGVSNFLARTNFYSPFEGELLHIKPYKKYLELNPYKNVKTGLFSFNKNNTKDSQIRMAMFKYYLKNININKTIIKKGWSRFNLILTKNDLLAVNYTKNNIKFKKGKLISLEQNLTVFSEIHSMSVNKRKVVSITPKITLAQACLNYLVKNNVNNYFKIKTLADLNKQNHFTNKSYSLLKNMWLNKTLLVTQKKVKEGFADSCKLDTSTCVLEPSYSYPDASSRSSNLGLRSKYSIKKINFYKIKIYLPSAPKEKVSNKLNQLTSNYSFKEAASHIAFIYGQRNIPGKLYYQKTISPAYLNNMTKRKKAQAYFFFVYNSILNFNWLFCKQRHLLTKNKIGFFLLKGNRFINSSNKITNMLFNNFIFLNKNIYNLENMTILLQDSRCLDLMLSLELQKLHLNNNCLGLKSLQDKSQFLKTIKQYSMFTKISSKNRILNNNKSWKNFNTVNLTLWEACVPDLHMSKTIALTFDKNPNGVVFNQTWPIKTYSVKALVIRRLNIATFVNNYKKQKFYLQANNITIFSKNLAKSYKFFNYVKLLNINSIKYIQLQILISNLLSQFLENQNSKTQRNLLGYAWKTNSSIIEPVKNLLNNKTKQILIKNYKHKSKCKKIFLVIKKSGQILQMNKQKVTIRLGQPLVISPRSIIHGTHGDFITNKTAVVTLTYLKLKTGDIVQGIPKIEQLFEARTTKRGRLFRDNVSNLLTGLFLKYFIQSTYILRTQTTIKTLGNGVSQEGLLDIEKNKLQPTKKINNKFYNQFLNNKHNEKAILALALQWSVKQSFYKIQQIIVDGILRVYRSQGVSIADKHVEIIVKQMTSKVRIINTSKFKMNEYKFSLKNITRNLNTEINKQDIISENIKTKKSSSKKNTDQNALLEQLLSNNFDGPTGLFPGEIVDIDFVENINNYLFKTSSLVKNSRFDFLFTVQNSSQSSNAFAVEPIKYEPIVLGITRASLEVESFLSAASFQQTTKVLSQAALYKKKDFLKGLKENIIIGNLIPAGTGYLSSINF